MRVLGNKPPIRRVQGLESTADSDLEYTPSGTHLPTYHSATPTRYSEVHPMGSPRHMEDYGAEEIPSRDLVIRLLFQNVQKMENDRTRSQELEWGKLRPRPFIERIKHSRHDKDLQLLRILFYTGVEDPLTHLHTFQSALGCKGLSDEG